MTGETCSSQFPPGLGLLRSVPCAQGPVCASCTHRPGCLVLGGREVLHQPTSLLQTQLRPLLPAATGHLPPARPGLRLSH